MGRCDVTIPSRVAVFLFVALLATVSAATGQTTGSIQGTVTDQNGGVLRGVSVEISSPNLQGVRTAITDASGRFHSPSLPPGPYKVVASLEGFAKGQRNATVALDSTAEVNIQLQLSTTAEVTVSAQTPMVDVNSTTIGTNYTSKTIEGLPVGRNYAEIIRSNPGVNTDQGDTQGRALALTVYGATSVENQFIIDGVNTTNVIRGFQGKAINGEFIQEIEIKTGGYQAEYGRALGGVINVITKSGGNEFHGDGFVYYDNYGMRANQVINDQDNLTGVRVSGYNKTDFGVDVGGRIIKDKLWFFAAYDRLQRPADVSNYQDNINADGVVVVPKSAQFPADSTDNLYSGKLTWNAATGTTIVGTVFADPSNVSGAANSDPTHSTYPSTLTSLDPNVWSSELKIGGTDYALRVSQLFGSNALATIQGSHHKDRYNTIAANAEAIRYDDWTCSGGTPDNPCTQPNAPLSSTGGFGAVTGYLQNNDSTRDQVRGDFTFYPGNHEVKVGGDYMKGKTNAVSYYSGLQQVLKYNEYGQPYYAHTFWAVGQDNLTPTGNEVSPKTYNASFFAQDSWRVIPGLTINAGLRWDQEDLRDYTGSTVIKLTNEWQPRLGIIWDPSRNGSTKIYAFFGRFYYALPTDLNVRSYGHQLLATTYNFDPVSVVQDPTVIGHETTHIQGGVFAEPHDAGLKGIYQDEFSIGFEKLLDPSFSVGIRGEYRRFGRAVEDRCDADPSAPENNGNTCVITNPGGSGQYGSGNFTGCNGLDGAAYECGLNPIATALPGNSNVGASRLYRGIELTARKTFGVNGWLQASYVYSSLRGNYDGEVKQNYAVPGGVGQTDPGITADFDYASFIHNKYGKLYLDRPHNFRLDTTYITPFKLSVGLQTWVQSGPPLSQIGYFNQFYIAQSYLVPYGSAGRLKTQWESNLSVGYPVQIGPVTVSGLLYLFNIFNNQIITNVDNNWQISQGVNYPKTPDQYSQLFYAPCTAAQASDPVANKCNEQKNANYGKAFTRQDPRLLRAAIKISF